MIEQVSGIAPFPEVIAVGGLATCVECDSGRIEDHGLERIPYTVMMDCPMCKGRGSVIEFTDYDPGRMW